MPFFFLFLLSALSDHAVIENEATRKTQKSLQMEAGEERFLMTATLDTARPDANIALLVCLHNQWINFIPAHRQANLC